MSTRDAPFMSEAERSGQLVTIVGPGGETWRRLSIAADSMIHWVIMDDDGVDVDLVGVSLPVTDGVADVSRIDVSDSVGLAQLVAILQAELRRVIDV